jgi:hypothetical protein
MNTKAILGYTISILGIIIFALTSDTVKEAIGLNLPNIINIPTQTIISLVLIIIGIVLVWKFGSSSNKKFKDLPIYQGKDIVGYRRHGK